MSGGCDRERTDEERTIDELRQRLAQADRRGDNAAADRDRYKLERDEALTDKEALAATVERLIREAGAIRLDERQRAKAEHDSLADEGRARCERRCEGLEDTIARMRRIIDDADRAKAEHEKTRDELRRLHDVLSGAKKL